jgi:uncharacterized damage-inducible protein DinB
MIGYSGDEMRICEAILLEFDYEMANTRKVLERVADAKWGWKPHQKSFAMGELATHVANIPGWLVEVIGKDSLELAPGGVPYKSPLAASNAELLSMFDKHVADGRAAIGSTDNEHLAREWELLFGGQQIFKMPRTAVIRSFVMNHHIHHRAQLTMYLRLNDIPVPGLYGPSADEK